MEATRAMVPNVDATISPRAATGGPPRTKNIMLIPPSDNVARNVTEKAAERQKSNVSDASSDASLKGQLIEEDEINALPNIPSANSIPKVSLAIRSLSFDHSEMASTLSSKHSKMSQSYDSDESAHSSPRHDEMSSPASKENTMILKRRNSSGSYTETQPIVRDEVTGGIHVSAWSTAEEINRSPQNKGVNQDKNTSMANHNNEDEEGDENEKSFVTTSSSENDNGDDGEEQKTEKHSDSAVNVKPAEDKNVESNVVGHNSRQEAKALIHHIPVSNSVAYIEESSKRSTEEQDEFDSADDEDDNDVDNVKAPSGGVVHYDDDDDAILMYSSTYYTGNNSGAKEEFNQSDADSSSVDAENDTRSQSSGADNHSIDDKGLKANNQANITSAKPSMFDSLGNMINTKQKSPVKPVSGSTTIQTQKPKVGKYELRYSVHSNFVLTIVCVASRSSNSKR